MKNITSDVTYIIVTWKNEKEISECLKSIEEYSPQNHEVIIVDNNSDDRTTQIIREDFPKAKLIESSVNLGFAAANNMALQYVTTPYICYLNPDVILTEDIITPSIQVLKEKDQIGLVACRLKNKDGSNQDSFFNYTNRWITPCAILHIGAIMPQSLRKKYFLSKYNAKADFEPEWVIGAEMILRTEEAKKIGGFSEEYFMYTEDMDLCKKVNTILGKKIYYLANVSLVHLGGASEAQNTNYNKQKKIFENEWMFVKKFYGMDEANRTIRSMKRAHMIRKTMLNIGYWKKDRQYQIKRTNAVIEMLDATERKVSVRYGGGFVEKNF